MKIKMWCVINTSSKSIVQIGVESDFYVVGFATKEGLQHAIGNLEHDEKIQKVEIEI